MPTTEAPSSPPTESPKRSPLRAIPRGDLSHHELLQLLDSLEDEQARARRREGFWIALIVHIILFWLWSYGPTLILHHPRVISPAEAIKQRQKDFTYLDLPPDALKQIKPKQSDVISDKNRVQQTPHPTLDKKTIEQLQAMKRAGEASPPPAPVPAPQQQAQAAPEPAPQQQQAQANPKPELQPLQPAPTQQPNVTQSPRQPAQKPNFNTGGSIRDQLNEAIRSASRGQGTGGEEGAGAPLEHPGAAAGAEILSETMGVDFAPYLQRVVHATKQSWYNLIPESARPPLNRQGRVVIEFIIQPDGTVKQMRLVGPSGDTSLDRAAWGGIQGASPYPQLPKDFKGPYLALRFGFYYNERPDAR
jgi:TonB family protein